MLDEEAKRGPDFIGPPNAVGIVFGDGSTWFVPLPWLEYRPVFKNFVATECRQRFTYDRVIDDMLGEICDDGDAGTLTIAAASVAASLLKRQYDLTEPELDGLLCFRPDVPESMTWISDVVKAARGMYGRRK
jgi:hypothetical protein